MPLRLLEMVLPESHAEDAQELVKEQDTLQTWYHEMSEGQALIKILVEVEATEPLMDLLDERFSHIEGFRLVMLPVAASLPRVEKEVVEKEAESEPQAEAGEKKPPLRISREELYTQIADTTKPSVNFIAMVALSAVVASIGLIFNNTAVVIGAMVIAPLLGPNMALALAVTLGDMPLARISLKANSIGLLLSLAIAIIMGVLLHVDPHNQQIASRTRIDLMDMVLALASGVAGTLSFTSGASSALIGVMVAVALVPPLVVLGLMLGAGYLVLALDALWLLLTNMICINLAAVATFWVQGIRPITWWEADIARRATIISIVFSLLVLAALILILVIFSKKF